jgi:hypothetical protein
MTDDLLRLRLPQVDDPQAPDPTFATELYVSLVGQLGLLTEPATPVTRLKPVQTYRWRPLLLAALLLLGGGLAMGAVLGFAGRGRLSDAGVPRVCELIGAEQIAMVVGAPVTLTQPETLSSANGADTTACGYEYAPVHSGGDPRSVDLAISRYADSAAARAFLQVGQSTIATPALGDGAVLMLQLPRQELYVLHGSDVVTVGTFAQAGGLQPITPDEMEQLAQLILTALERG